MRQSARSVSLVAITAAIAIMTAVLGGCSELAPPSGEPSIRGPVTSITPGSNGLGIILVEETAPQGLDYDKGALTITKDTVLLKRVGDDYAELAFDDLSTGTPVEVWITGAVAESYPIQAAADTVVALE